MFALQAAWFYLLMLAVPLAIGGLLFPERSVISPVSFCSKAEFAFLHQVRHLHHSLPGSLLHHSLTGGRRKSESFA